MIKLHDCDHFLRARYFRTFRFDTSAYTHAIFAFVQGVGAPIFHCNGDDPEGVAHCCRLAVDWRQVTITNSKILSSRTFHALLLWVLASNPSRHSTVFSVSMWSLVKYDIQDLLAQN